MGDIDVIRELNDKQTVHRLYSVMELVKDKTMLPQQKELFDFIVGNKSDKVQSFFHGLYWKLVK
jgi:hypothetical protein